MPGDILFLGSLLTCLLRTPLNVSMIEHATMVGTISHQVELLGFHIHVGLLIMLLEQAKVNGPSSPETLKV